MGQTCRKSCSRIAPRRLASRAIATAVCFGFVLGGGRAKAQFSAQDGYAENGGYRVQVEVTPYLWLPATSGTARIGGNFVGRDFSFSSGPPSPADLAHSLHGALIAYGLLRYGPWSAELDFQWIDAFHKSTLQVTPAGPGGTVKDTVSLVRVAPGLGYQVYSGAVAGIPTTVDARVGFSVLTWDLSAKIEELPFSGVDAGRTFAQPWAGFRADFYPGRNWRLELAAIAEGFGVNGGVWGWGASALVSYSITSWLDVTGGIRALSSRDRRNGSLDITAYGPVLGFGFRF